MATVLTKGTKEYVLADLTDASGELTELTGTNPRFDVITPTGTNKYTNEPAVIDVGVPMRVRCMIDTNSGGTWVAGTYKLFITLDTLPEVPRLGPFPFTIVD